MNPRRHTRKHLDGDGFHIYKKRSGFLSFIVYSVISALIFILIFSIFFYPESVKEFFEESKETISERVFTLSSEDYEKNNTQNLSNVPISIVSKCRSQYIHYSNIGESKYDVDYDIITIKKIWDEEELKEFNELYSFLLSPPPSLQTSSNYPVVGIAATLSGPGGQIPLVVNCDYKGDLTEDSKNTLVLIF